MQHVFLFLETVQSKSILKAFQHFCVHSNSPCCGFFKHPSGPFFLFFCMKVLEYGWSHAVISCILNGQRGIVDWLFMCLKRKGGRGPCLVTIVQLVLWDDIYTLSRTGTRLSKIDMGVLQAGISPFLCAAFLSTSVRYAAGGYSSMQNCYCWSWMPANERRQLDRSGKEPEDWHPFDGPNWQISCSRRLPLRQRLQAEDRVGRGTGKVLEHVLVRWQVYQWKPCSRNMWGRVVAR